jgi:predicted Rossmann fold flavoprotein
MEDHRTHYPLIIIGGGPAGLMAAISADSSSTLLIEKGPKSGRKLLITAAGQCNLTHRGTIPELLEHYDKGERFLRPALYGFSNSELINFFEDRGVPTFFDEKDRCLPKSLSARDILNQLLLAAREKGTDFHYNDRVLTIEMIGEGENPDTPETARFRVITKLRNYYCDSLILATGGKSYPKTGSTGDGYTLAQSLGHTIIEARPALTAVESNNFALTPLSGLSFDNIMVEIYRQDKMVHRFKDNLLITHRGLSGPVIINNSRSMKKGDELRVDFSGIGRDEVTEKIKKASAEEGKRALGSFLKNLEIPRKIIPYLLSPGGSRPGDEGSINPEKPLSQLTKQERSLLISHISAYPVTISRLQGWDSAMVTAGGVDTKEINPKTMESRVTEGLYFAGEIIDVDGDSGGYNLQAAFSTGWLAGNNIKRNRES